MSPSSSLMTLSNRNSIEPAGLRISQQLSKSVSCLVLKRVRYASPTGSPFVSTILDGMRGLWYDSEDIERAQLACNALR